MRWWRWIVGLVWLGLKRLVVKFLVLVSLSKIPNPKFPIIYHFEYEPVYVCCLYSKSTLTVVSNPEKVSVKMPACSRFVMETNSLFLKTSSVVKNSQEKCVKGCWFWHTHCNLCGINTKGMLAGHDSKQQAGVIPRKRNRIVWMRS